MRRIPIEESDDDDDANSLEDDDLCSEELFGNQEAYLQRRGHYPPYNDLDLADDYAEHDTQGVDFNRVATNFSPTRAVNLSGPSIDAMEDPFLQLIPSFNKEVIDCLYAECPNANLGKMASVLSFAARIKAGSVPVASRYRGYVEIYRFAGSTHNYGRLYCLNGAQSVMGKVRRHLFHGIYEDIDIVNAQPSMLRQLMNRLDYKGPSNAIAEYVDHRDECLEALVDGCSKPITKDDAKTFFISTLFGSSLRAWEQAHGDVEGEVRELLLVPWEREVSAFVQYFIDRHGAEIARYDKKTDEQIRAEGKSVAHRRFSLMMQNEERNVMLKVIDFVTAIRGSQVGVLVHDGILASVPCGAASILSDLHQFVLEQTGYSLAFAVKSLEPTETLAELVLILKGAHAGIEIPEYDPKVNQDCLFSDTFLKLNKDKLLFDESGTIFHFADDCYPIHTRGTWHMGVPPGEWWNVFPDTPYSQDANKMLTMTKILKMRYPQYRAQIKWENYAEHWFPLRDCLVNLITGETRAFSPELHLNRKIDLAYVPNALESPEYAAQVDEMMNDMRLLYNKDNTLMAAMEEIIAYCLFTRGNWLKKLFNLVGDGNNGKSTFLQRAAKVAGPAFVTSLDAKHLSCRADPTKPNPRLCAAVNCNMVTVEEPAKDERMEGALTKELTGGTPVLVRNLYSNGASEMPNNMKLIICSNHAVQFKNPDPALNSRIERIQMPCKFFRNEAERTAALESIDCLIERTAAAPKYHVGDPNFVRRYDSVKMRQVYFAFLQQQYKNFITRGALTEVPEIYSYRGCEDEEVEPEPHTLFDELIETTGDDDHFMTAKAICDLLRAKNTISIGLHMKSRIVSARGPRGEQLIKAIRKKKAVGYSGIRPRNQGFGTVTAYDSNGF
jgi:hypothetical protein